MSVFILIICIFVQRYMHFYSQSYQVDWVSPFYSFCNRRFAQQMESIPLIGLALLVLPPLLFVICIFNLFEHLLGVTAYWVLSLVWCWYCLNVFDLSSRIDGVLSLGEVAKSYFHQVFAVVFWFLLGPLWLVFYIVIREVSYFGLRHHGSLVMFSYARFLLSILDWLPVRLFGLSLALISHFTRLLKLWLSSLYCSLSRTEDLISEWVDVAVETLDESMSLGDRLKTLMEYSLVVWLVIALVLAIASLF